MIEKMFLIRDAKAEDWGRPQYARTIGEMIRTIEDECKNEQSLLNKYPEDYTLFHIGEYNRGSGEFKFEPQPVSLGCVANFKKANV